MTTTPTPTRHRPVALITGGSRGLGRAAALALARRDMDVILTWHRQQAEADAVVSEIQSLGGRAAAVQLDLADSRSFAGFAAQVKKTLNDVWQCERFDHLVNNAGVGAHSAFAETTEAQFDLMVAVHLKGPFLLTQALLPLINDGGSILNVSSGLTRFALPGYAAYAAMKGGVEVMTRYLAKELGPRGIRANVIAPGAVATDFGGGAVRDNAELNAFVAAQTALGRVGQADDIGTVMASLVSDDHRWVNAQRIEASGGMFL